MLEITVRIIVEDSGERRTTRTIEVEERQFALYPEGIERVAMSAVNAAALGVKAPRHSPAVNG